MIDEKEQIAQYFIDMLAVEFEKGRKEGYKAGYKAGVGDAKNPTLTDLDLEMEVKNDLTKEPE